MATGLGRRDIGLPSPNDRTSGFLLEAQARTRELRAEVLALEIRHAEARAALERISVIANGALHDSRVTIFRRMALYRRALRTIADIGG